MDKEQTMKQYCRYCAFCFEGDMFYCSAQSKPLHRIDTVNQCKDFVYSELGDLCTGKQYKPREKVKSNYEQIDLFKE